MPPKTTHKNNPDNWKQYKLIEIVDKKRPIGYWIVQTWPNNNSWPRCIRVVDFSNWKIDESNLIRTSPEIHQSYRRTILKEWDLVVALRWKAGEICMVPKTLEWANLTRWVALIAINENNSSKFIRLASDGYAVKKHFLKSMNGSALQEISIGELRKVPVLLPPLPEQNRIVAVLETWDRAIESMTKKIDIKKQVKKGLMQELLTGKTRLKGFSGKWEKMKIKNIGQVVTGNTPPKKNPDYYGDEYLWATAFDFNGTYIEDTQVKLSGSGAQVARIVPKGSVLVTCIASIGKNAIAKKEMWFNQQINAIIPNKNFSSEFIYYLVEWSFHKLKEVAGGGALAMISKGVFETIVLAFPKIDEQNAIANILTASDNEINSLEKKLSLLKDQKKYLLNNLITGEIRTPENLTLYS